MRFLHTSDWQLGLSRYYLDQDARARYAADRFEAIRRLGDLATAEEASFVVVAGDVFDKNLIDRRTLLRGFDAMRAAGVPFFLLPGNHDPLDAASVYRSPAFRAECPANVQVLDGEAAVVVTPEIEVVGAPWPHKEPRIDLVARRAETLNPMSGRRRVLVGHGAVDVLNPDADDPARIRMDGVRRALDDRLYDFLALGDRHSATQVEPAVWYSGTPEATDFNEERPGRVLRVDLGDGEPRVKELDLGRWRFERLRFELTGEADLEALRSTLDAMDDPSRTALRLRLDGHLPIHSRADLDRLLAGAGERFAAVDRVGDGLTLVPDDLDRDALDLGGWAAAAFEELLAVAAKEEDPAGNAVGEASDTAEREGESNEEVDERTEAQVAADALALLYRLAGDVGSGSAEAGSPDAVDRMPPNGEASS